MIPQRIVRYLDSHAVPYDHRLHRCAITAEELAATLHVPGSQVAKSVVVKAGDQIWIAVLPATRIVDERRLSALLDVPALRLLHEPEFEGMFPDCEPGAEPPFGALFGLPVVVDASLAECDRIVFRAGSHEESIVMRYEDFYRLEKEPPVGIIGRARASLSRLRTSWAEPTAR